MKKINLMLLIFGALALVGCESNEPNYNYSSGKKPTASFEFKVVQPISAEFYNTSKNATSYEWEIDGEKITEKEFRYKFKGKGVYKVTMTAYNGSQSDVCEATVTIHEPTRCYFAGITYNNLDLKVFNKYIYFKLIDDDFFTTTWVTSVSKLISSANLPFDFIFKEKVLLDGLSQDDWYKIQIFYSNSPSGSGTNLYNFQFYTSKLLSEFPTEMTWNEGGAIGSKNSITAHFIWE